MPQMSPMVWPLVISMLLLLTMMLKSNMPKFSLEGKSTTSLSYKGKKWKW